MLVQHAATGPGRRIGTLFINPGGPGDQGTTQIPRWVGFAPAVLRQRFDIISWDPRGINDSTAVQCFANRHQETGFLGQLDGFPVRSGQQRAYIKKWAEVGQRCARRNGVLLYHVTTTETAHDLDLLRQAVGDSKLTYLGLSYGTYLGATYANLFPDKVRALVFDGNIAPDVWTNRGKKASLSISLRIGSDTGAAETLDALLRLCGQASTAHCAFSAGSAAKTQAKFAALLARLRKGPITLESSPSARSVTYAHLLSGISDGLNTVQPHANARVPGAVVQGWPGLAAALQELWQARDRPARPSPVASSTGTPSPPAGTYAGPEQGLAVTCADSPSPGPGQFGRLDRLEQQRAGTIGLVALWHDEPCSTWPAHSTAGYHGPWNTPTAAPILVIGNTTDPATPLTNAVAMVAELANARLLTVRGYGHTAFANQSSCANHAEVAYLVHGTLPPIGTSCQQDATPFSAPTRS